MISWPELEGAWCAATSADPDGWTAKNRWTEKNPAFGQCAVTALIVQDYFGGILVRVENEGVSHYFNRIGGVEIDLTREQFGTWAPGEEVEREREYVLSFPETKRRYELLTARLVEPF